MKRRFLSILLVLLVSGGGGGVKIFAQTPFPMQEPIKLAMGEMTLGGMLLTGFSAEMKNQDGYDDDGVWKAGMVNPTYAENRVDLYLNYKLLDYGVFVNVRAQGYGQNQFGTAEVPNFHAYANFFNNKLKISAGKLNEWIYAIPDSQIWQTWFSGEMWSFTARGPGAVRVEVKPISGLNLGFQFPFVNQSFGEGDFKTGDDITDAEKAAYLEASHEARKDAWREFGFAAEYVKDDIKLVAGVQLDSKMDKLTRDDFRTYLDDYYGSANLLAFMDSVTFKEKPPVNYDGGLLAFAGTRLNLIKNLGIDFQMGFMGLGAFDKYGYGRINEHIGYTIEAVPGLGVGLDGTQQFYGANVFPDDKVNSPLFEFGCGVSYVLPFMTNVSVGLGGGMGFCKDVLESSWSLEPSMTIQINKIAPVCTVGISYKIGHTDFDDAIEADAAKPSTNHSLNFSASVYL